jgi:hypothetical protein
MKKTPFVKKVAEFLREKAFCLVRKRKGGMNAGAIATVF